MGAAGNGGSVLDASGYIVAQRQATVSSKVTGKVQELLVEEGQAVKQGQILARQGVGLGGHPQHQNHGQSDQCHPCQHGWTDADGRFDVAMNSKLLDDAMQCHRNDNCLEDKGDYCRDVEMRCVLDIGLPGDGKREHQGMQCKHIEERIEPILV